MYTINTLTWIIIACMAILVEIAIAVWLSYQKKQFHRIKERFGTEYDRSVDDLESQTKAES